MDKKEFSKFSLSVYGNITQYNEVLSKARCRIFYKYGNRNGTYITDEFAEKLISTLPYVPVKGIYDSTAGDYTDHGKQRYEGRIYGIVPENPNFAWEEHLDEDGKTRVYACTDVFLFTGIYKDEALEIANKAQSMELYADSLKGDWKYIEGKRYFVFTEGRFLGLQALGEDYEPCFEGAAFYTAYDSIKHIMEKIEQFELELTEGGAENMDFKLSNNQVYNMIWMLLNPEFSSEGGWQLSYELGEIYDEYAVAYNVNDGVYERIYYNKDNEADSLEITGRERTYIVDVNEEEKRALQVLHAMNGNTYEKVDEKVSEYTQEIENLNVKIEEYVGTTQELNDKNSEFEAKIEEYAAQISTLEQEKGDITVELEEVKNNYVASEEKVNELTSEVETLTAYKAAVEKAEKEAVINRYSEQLNSEELEPFRNDIDKYTKEELDKELAFILVQSRPTLFTNQGEPGYVPKDVEPTGIEGILSRYKK